MSFTASYDSTTKVISAVACALLAFIAIITQSIFAAGLGALILALSYAYSPRGYTISEQAILVQRLIGAARIPLDGIRELRIAGADDFEGCIRLFGNGGLFGYYGLYQTSKLGKCTWYVTNRANTVVVITGAKTVVFSPADVDGFLAAIRASVPVPVTQPGVPLQSYGRGNLTGKLIGAGLGIVVLAVVALSMMYSPGPPSYTLTPQSLTIHDRFYPVTLQAADVDVAGIRVVDFDVDKEWRPTARTNGFANAHYRSGHFRIANGRTIRMYQADSRRMVLLPPKGNGTAVLLETRKPEKFVAEVRQAWSPERAHGVDEGGAAGR